MNDNSTVLQNMTPIRRKCFPLFSLMHFIALLIPWPWACDSWIYSQAPRESSFCGKSNISQAQTDEFLSVSDNDLEYLTQDEAEQIIARFMEIPQSYDRLVFWTGMPREWVQQWADDHNMLTLTSAMGPLMDHKDPSCLRKYKELAEWSKYIKGASGIFARYACKRGIVRVLTLPPSWANFIRPESTYRNIEEPVLKGRTGYCCAVQINTVHLLTTLGDVEYQTWPQNHIPEKLTYRGAVSSKFRLPRWTRKALRAATKSLRSNCVSQQPQSKKRPQTQQTTSNKRQPQTQQISSKKEQAQTQQTMSKKQQPHTQQITSKKKQPQTQQMSSKNKKPQTQESSSKKQQSQAQKSSNKKQQSQAQKSSNKKQQSQAQKSSNKKQQPQGQQPQSKKQQPQSQQTSSRDKKPQTQELLSKNKKPQTQQSSSKKQQPQQPQQPQKQQPQKQQSQKQQPRSKKPAPQNSKQPQPGKQPQSSKKLKIKAGALLQK